MKKKQFTHVLPIFAFVIPSGIFFSRIEDFDLNVFLRHNVE